jgi:D-tyrosyl-tRNA(Tyr) deacylase
VLLGVAAGDGTEDADYLAEKVVNLRIFSDHEGKFNLSALQVKGEMLVISQFTLLADARKGRRPSFSAAAPPDQADALYNYFMVKVRAAGIGVESGIFGAHMKVELVNDGPVTIMLDSAERQN